MVNRSLGGYLKAYIPVDEDHSRNIAVSADYVFRDTDSWYGATSYMGRRHSANLSLMYGCGMNGPHRFAFGLDGMFDSYDEALDRTVWVLGPVNTVSDGTEDLWNAGVFGEYSFHAGDRFSATARVRGAWYSGAGFRLVPEVSLKYAPVEQIVVRTGAGRGLRYTAPLSENSGVFLTGKSFRGDLLDHTLEDAWTIGGDITYYVPFGSSSDTYLEFRYFRTQYIRQAVVDYEMAMNSIWFYNLDGNRSWEDNFRLVFSVVPVERFTVSLSCRYTDAKIELRGRGLSEKPMVPRFGGELELQYATRHDKWIFGLAASLNGSCRVYDFMSDAKDADGNLLYENGRTPVYPLLSAQVTRRFKCVDVFIGGENLTNFRQKNVLLGIKGADGFVNPRLQSFDASAVWGPVVGVSLYVGVRFTLWKDR